MNILLHGAGFVNKGAQLMLACVCRQLRDSGIAVELFVSAVPGDVKERGSLGLGSVFPPVEHYSTGAKFAMRRWLFCAAGCMVPRSLRARYAIEPMTGMDALIDLSGYAYADRFGCQNLIRTARLARSFANRGKPVLFLPQMWGPFGDPIVSRAVTELAGNADLLYARDQTSVTCLVEAGVAAERVRVSPDITIPMSVSGIDVQTPKDPFCCVVPNSRMIDQGDWGGRHAALLTRAAEIARELGVEPVLLVHDDAGEDGDLARSIAASLGGGVTVYVNEDPLKLKGFIARSRCLIGSRYHSLVAALSQGVPVLAMGWAHKYPELLADFNCGPMAFDETHPDSAILQSAERLFDPETNDGLRRRIRSARQDLVARIETMWTEVVSLLESNPSRRE